MYTYIFYQFFLCFFSPNDASIKSRNTEELRIALHCSRWASLTTQLIRSAYKTHTQHIILSILRSCKTHDSVQDVLRLRDVPVEPVIEIGEFPKPRELRQQDAVQEVEAHAADSVCGQVPSDSCNNSSVRFTPKPLS